MTIPDPLAGLVVLGAVALALAAIALPTWVTRPRRGVVRGTNHTARLVPRQRVRRSWWQ